MMTVKICGITNLRDACEAAEAGADLLGFVFYPTSARYVAPASACEIIRAVRQAYRVRAVGVFVNAPVCEMREVMERCALDFAQLSGDEPVEVVREIGPWAIKALRPRDPSALASLLDCYVPGTNGNLPSFLIDGFSAKLYGGTGERADWVQAREVARHYSILLAGGLTPENVAEAVQTVQPWGVDVSSGVERAPGLKDHDKVRQFIIHAKGDFK